MVIRRALLTVISVFFITACSQKNLVRNIELADNVKDINKLDYTSGIEACTEIIENSTARNHYLLGREVFTSDEVLITAIPLTIEVIQARAKKRTLERRWSNAKYQDFLNKELTAYTNFRLDKSGTKIVRNDTLDAKSGYNISFIISFQNHTVPFRTIEVDGGFECFFFENKLGHFGRVESISDDFLFDYILLDGFMSTIVTFKTKNDFGQPLFKKGTYPETFSLIFNGFDSKPIKLVWNFSKGKKVK